MRTSNRYLQSPQKLNFLIGLKWKWSECAKWFWCQKYNRKLKFFGELNLKKRNYSKRQNFPNLHQIFSFKFLNEFDYKFAGNFRKVTKVVFNPIFPLRTPFRLDKNFLFHHQSKILASENNSLSQHSVTIYVLINFMK